MIFFYLILFFAFILFIILPIGDYFVWLAGFVTGNHVTDDQIKERGEYLMDKWGYDKEKAMKNPLWEKKQKYHLYKVLTVLFVLFASIPLMKMLKDFL